MRAALFVNESLQSGGGIQGGFFRLQTHPDSRLAQRGATEELTITPFPPFVKWRLSAGRLPNGRRWPCLDHFDAWAATFGEVINTMEISPDGASLRPRS